MAVLPRTAWPGPLCTGHQLSGGTDGKNRSDYHYCIFIKRNRLKHGTVSSTKSGQARAVSVLLFL